jgi:phage portal protein BeeE
LNLLSALLRPRAAWSQPPFWSLRDNQIAWTSVVSSREEIETNFQSYVQRAYKANGVVFACILARLLVFSEARFQWRRLQDGRPSDMFGDTALALLEKPWPNATTGELLARMEQDTSLAGNFFATIVGEGEKRRIRRLRPDWVTIVTGSPDEDDPFSIEAEPVAYIYEPRTGLNKSKPVILTVEQVVHWSPIPDPEAQWRGMSWLQPIVDEISADTAATKHKLQFFKRGAMPGMVVSYDHSVSPEAFEKFVAHFKQTEGVAGAYKTLHLGGGADVKATSADLKQLDFKVTQGAGETRVAAAAGVHPVIVGLSEGLAGSSLNAGNFGAARRRFADGTIRPLWRSASAALEKFAQPKPSGSVHLWTDDRDVPFLREDAKEAAAIRKEDAAALEMLVRAGYTPESAVDAIISGDFRKLAHTGRFSVQLVPPDSDSEPKETTT